MKSGEISFYKNNVTLSISCNEELQSIFEGSLTVNDLTINQTYYADSMDYINDFKKNKKEIKADLKKINQYYKNVIKDIAWVVKKARAFKLIKTNENNI